MTKRKKCEKIARRHNRDRYFFAIYTIHTNTKTITHLLTYTNYNIYK